MARWTAAEIPDLSGRSAVVTGANIGLGYHTALELARKGARVLIGCRNPARGEAALRDMREQLPEAHIELLIVDVSDLESVARFADEIRDRLQALDILVNNAGIVMPPYGRTAQGFERQIGTNFLGPFALTGLLLDRLEVAPAARVVNVASQAHRIGGLDVEDLHFERRRYNERKGYGQSKLAILSWTFELQRRLRDAGHSSQALAAHPGYAATNIANSDMKMARFWLGRMAMKLGNLVYANSAHKGALCSLYAAVSPDAEGGDYIGPNGLFEMRGWPRKVSASRAAHSAETARRLWQVAEQATGVRYMSASVSAEG